MFAAERARVRAEVNRLIKATLRVNQTLTFTVEGHRVSMTPTGDVGCDSKRPRYFVGCGTCGKVLHENTTGPAVRIVEHVVPLVEPDL